MPLTDAQLAGLRRSHTATLTAFCEIWRSSPTLNSAGGVTDHWTLLAANIPCRVMPENSRRVLDTFADRPALLALYRLTLPYDADLHPDDQVRYEEQSFRVLALWDMHQFRTATRAIIAVIT